ncbi:MAG: lysophospholipid acyltransferase family protein [Deltaproteobacteria bacterium]|nr:lysophospholipid acyltransferase family protein [Deltaproteobacteria bacterium]
MAEPWAHRVEYDLFRLVERAFSGLNWKRRSALGRAVGRLWHAVDARHRGIALENVGAAFPEWSAAEVRRLVSANFQHLGVTGAECLGLRSATAEEVRDRVRFAGTEHLDEARARGKGVFLLTGHVGNWELAGAAMAVNGSPFAAVGKRLANGAVDRRVIELRERFGSRIIPHRRAVSQVLRGLGRGELIAFLMDQRPRRNEAVESRFFGRRVATNHGLALLALKTGAPVIPVFDERTGEGHVLTFHPALEPPREGEREERIRRYTALFDEIIEAAVRRRPEQWFWVHRRWRLPWKEA